jgi:DNA gyrase/topoisomerase IV subunit A
MQASLRRRGKWVLAISENGYGKRSHIEEIPHAEQGGQGPESMNPDRQERAI